MTAVDSAAMVLETAEGIEEQTCKLFEACRLRDVPIITFVNYLDRECREPFDLIDEIEQTLALDVTPASWPIGMGCNFLGTCDLIADAFLLWRAESTTEPEGRPHGRRACSESPRPRRAPDSTVAVLAQSSQRTIAQRGAFD